MTVDDKIQKAKDCFEDIQKKGRNNFQKFDYLEAEQIFPVVRDICETYKLRTKFEWDLDNNAMKLVIQDTEDGTVDTSTIPLAPITAQDPGKHMQDIGRIQTYAMRYLYIQRFEIAVPDEIDNKDQKKMVKQEKANAPKAKRNKPQKNVSPVKPVKQEKTSEVTAERVQEIISTADKQWQQKQLQKLEKDRQPFTWNNAKDFIKKLCDNEAEYQACSQSLVFKDASDIPRGDD